LFNDPGTKEPSISVTLVAVTFTVVLLRWVFGGLTIGGHTLGTVSTGEIESWLTPVFFLYFGRKATTATADVALAKAKVTTP
jgi:hypothetical protein